MPAIFAHYIFGVETMRRFDDSIMRIIKSHQKLYFVGLQGPDFYFFDQLLYVRGKRYAAIGSRLHHEPCARLLGALEGDGGRRPDSESLAYLLGLIGHFSLDSTCHPLIDRWVEELPYNHHRMETEFDRYLMAGCGISEPRCFPLGSLIAADRRERLKVGHMYESANLGRAEDVAEMIADFGRIKNLLQTPEDGRYRFYQNVLRMVGAQEALGGIFMGPKDALSDITNPCLAVLFEQAKQRYVMLAENYMSHVFNGAPLDEYFLRNFETEPEVSHENRRTDSCPVD